MPKETLQFLYRHVPSGRVLMARTAFLATILLGAPAAMSDSAGAFPETPWGYDTPAGRCVVCHSLEEGGPFRVAPNLWNIMGAEKARDSEWYAYSPALLEMGGVWTADDLDRFLEDAGAFAPGSTKSIRVGDSQERQEIIDFLMTLRD